jgi:hypothetical protein
VSQTKPLTGIERRDNYVAQNGAVRLTPVQRQRLAKKTRALQGDSEGATPKRPKAPVRSAPIKGRKRFFADFMRAHYARARADARRRRQKLGRFTAPR